MLKHEALTSLAWKTKGRNKPLTSGSSTCSNEQTRPISANESAHTSFRQHPNPKSLTPDPSRARELRENLSLKFARPLERSETRRSFCSTTAKTARRFGCFFVFAPFSAATVAPSCTLLPYRCRFRKRKGLEWGISGSGAVGRKYAPIRWRRLVAFVH